MRCCREDKSGWGGDGASYNEFDTLIEVCCSWCFDLANERVNRIDTVIRLS